MTIEKAHECKIKKASDDEEDFTDQCIIWHVSCSMACTNSEIGI
jgi:hypothetical protein